VYFMTSARLGFRTWREDDLDLATALWGNADVMRHIGGVQPREAIAARLAREIATQAEAGIQYWPIFLLDGGAHVGCCGLRPYRPEQRTHELGFHVLPAYWRQGYAEEAALAVVDHAFFDLGVWGLFAGHNPQNAASRRLLEKLGFRYTHSELYPPTRDIHPCYRLDAPTMP
jgi:RimJ/RimL family protein N-acetyltransferase